MKKMMIFLFAVLLVVPMMAQTIVPPPEKGSVEEFTKYYQQREAKAKTELDQLNQQLKSLEEQIAKIEAEKNAIRQWTPEEKSLLKEFEQVKKEYTVKKGDWLSKLAEYPEVYGKGNYWKWPVIYRANRDQIKNPDLIYPGQTFKIPRVLPTTWKVFKGETLKKIASYYEVYYSVKKWKKLYEGNKDKISNPNRISVGMTLDIPRP